MVYLRAIATLIAQLPHIWGGAKRLALYFVDLVVAHRHRKTMRELGKAIDRAKSTKDTSGLDNISGG